MSMIASKQLYEKYRPRRLAQILGSPLVATLVTPVFLGVYFFTPVISAAEFSLAETITDMRHGNVALFAWLGPSRIMGFLNRVGGPGMSRADAAAAAILAGSSTPLSPQNLLKALLKEAHFNKSLTGKTKFQLALVSP